MKKALKSILPGPAINFLRLARLCGRVDAIREQEKGQAVLNCAEQKRTEQLQDEEHSKQPDRQAIINFLLSTLNRETIYLEIGVRNPEDNFNNINANLKYSVDPGIEFASNPVDFQITSDEFFSQLSSGQILEPSIRFDVIFIDGLHLAKQVDRDICNSLHWIKDDGFIILHDCNPPTEWHARERYSYEHTPAGKYWNGTTWKAFLKWRTAPEIFSCCVDCDFGVGIISKTIDFNKNVKITPEFYDFWEFENDRHTNLGLLDYQELITYFHAKTESVNTTELR